MILLVHIMFGSALAGFAKNIYLAIPIGLISHYLLDAIPHVEYSIANIGKNQWNLAVNDYAKIAVDFVAGFVLIYLFSDNMVAWLGGLASIIPDGLSFSNSFIKNRLIEKHDAWHLEKIHFHKYKKIPLFWKIFSQAFIVILSILIFRL